MGKGNSDPSITIGYKYRMDMHLALCLGPVDAIKEFRTPEVTIWKGNVTKSGPLKISAPDVFGGKFKQGGVEGNIEVMLGEQGQTLNTKLSQAIKKSLPQAIIPSFRGVTTIFWDNLLYQSNTARPKSWSVRATRIPFKNTFGNWLADISRVYGTIHSLDIPNETAQLSSNSIVDLARKIYAETDAALIKSTASNTTVPTGVTEETVDNNLKRITDKTGFVHNVLDGLDVSLKTVTDSKNTLLDGSQIVLGSATFTKSGGVFKDTLGNAFSYDTETLIHRIGDMSTVISGSKYQSSANTLDSIGVRLYKLSEIAPVIPSDIVASSGLKNIITTITVASNYLGNTSSNNAEIPDISEWLQALNFPVDLMLEGRVLSFSANDTKLTWGGISYELRETKLFNGNSFKLFYMVNSITELFPFEVSDRFVEGSLTTTDILKSKGAIHKFTYTRMQFTQSATFDSGEVKPVTEYSDPVAAEIVRQEDANPAIIIAECLTSHSFGLDYPIEKLDQYSFTVTAEKLFQEGFGLSASWENSAPVEEFLSLVLQTINAVLYVDPSTAKFVLKLLRPDFEYADPSGSLKIKLADETNVVEVRKFTRTAISETVNQVTVQWTASTNGKQKSLTVNNPAAISMSDGIVAVTRDYSMVISDHIAKLIAERDLSILSQPMSAVELVVNRDFWNLSIGDVITWNWAEYGIEGMPLRISSISYGLKDDGKITLSCIEDVFREYETKYVLPTGDEWTTPIQPPSAALYTEVKELNIFEINLIKSASKYGTIANDLDTTTGIVAILAARPNSTCTDFAVNWVEAEQTGLMFTPYAILSNSLVREATTLIQLKSADGMEFISNQSYAYCDGEIFEIVSISFEKLQISVNRGMLGTVPLSHSADKVVWFYSDSLPNCIVTTSFIDGSTHNFKVLPRNALNEYLNLSAATAIPYTITSDWDRPPAPGWLRTKDKFLNSDVQGA